MNQKTEAETSITRPAPDERFVMPFHPASDKTPGVPSEIAFPYWMGWIRRRAQINHSQTLERLRERGGLDPSEVIALLENRRWEPMTVDEVKEAFRRNDNELQSLAPLGWMGLFHG